MRNSVKGVAMKRNIVKLILSCLMVTTLMLASCMSATPEEEEVTPPMPGEVTEQEEEVVVEEDEEEETQPIPSAVNEIQVDFETTCIRDVSEDTFTNRQVASRKEWHTCITNSVDENGMPVTGLGLTFTSELAFRRLMFSNLTTMAPPTYEWSFGNVPEGSQASADAGFEFVPTGPDSFPFIPGFDASRSVDKTIFTAPENQTLTVTVTPREKRNENLFIQVQADESYYTDAVIISTSGKNIKLSSDKHNLEVYDMPLKLNTPYSITVKIRVTPKVPKVEFMPYVGFNWGIDMPPHSEGTTKGSFLSFDVDGVGTWTWSAEGNYVWEWRNQAPNFLVGLHPRVSVIEND